MIFEFEPNFIEKSFGKVFFFSNFLQKSKWREMKIGYLVAIFKRYKYSIFVSEIMVVISVYIWCKDPVMSPSALCYKNKFKLLYYKIIAIIKNHVWPIKILRWSNLSVRVCACVIRRSDFSVMEKTWSPQCWGNVNFHQLESYKFTSLPRDLRQEISALAF